MRMLVSTRGLEEAQRTLIQAGDRFKDGRPVFKVIAYDLLQIERRRFQTANNGRWKKLDPATIRQKARRGQPTAALQATGTLMRALTQPHAPGQQVTLKPEELRFGLTPNGAAFYGRFHQKGQGVPKRILFSITPPQRASIKGKIRAYLVHGDVLAHGATPVT